MVGACPRGRGVSGFPGTDDGVIRPTKNCRGFENARLENSSVVAEEFETCHVDGAIVT